MKKELILTMAIVSWSLAAMADDAKFSTHLHAKFQAKACTTCHDYFEKKLGGIGETTHKGRTPDMCVLCHTGEVTGFEHPDEWFAQANLYTSGMDAKKACETIKTAIHAKFKSKELVARQVEKHLFEDPRVLWAIEGATPMSGNLPGNKKESNLVAGGLTEWKRQAKAWIAGGMRCD